MLSMKFQQNRRNDFKGEDVYVFTTDAGRRTPGDHNSSLFMQFPKAVEFSIFFTSQWTLVTMTAFVLKTIVVKVSFLF